MIPEPLIAAVRKNDESRFVDELQRLSVEAIESPNTVLFSNWFPARGATVLQLTSLARKNFATHVVNRGAHVDFHSACALGDLKSVERFLAADSDIVNQPVADFFPMQFALGEPAIVRRLLAAGDDANRRIERVAWFEWETQAIEAGVSDWSIFHMLALGRGNAPHTETADALKEAGGDVSATSFPFGDRPIHISSIYDRVELIQWFVENGCDVDLTTGPPHTSSAIKDLFPMGDFEPFGSSLEKTSLMLACGEGQFSAVEKLLQLGASVQVTDSDGHTPMHYASGAFWGENTKIVEMLLAHAADPRQPSAAGVSPSDLAKKRGYEATCGLLAAN